MLDWMCHARGYWSAPSAFQFSSWKPHWHILVREDGFFDLGQTCEELKQDKKYYFATLTEAKSFCQSLEDKINKTEKT